MHTFPTECTSTHEDGDTGECRVILVGTWPALRGEGTVPDGAAQITRCAERDELGSIVYATGAGWILAGQDLDDGDVQRTIAKARAVKEGIRLAILGQSRDWRRCERWMRRGCRVYLEDTINLRRGVAAIRASQTLEVNVMDRIFFEVLRERATGPAPHLTRRERDVLELLRRGMRNREIAGALFVTENTVEYHMRHLLSKFSARNRLEVVERATALGLA
ncbi:helix-turn-helix transcriptional regulator [Streptomyces niveus]|uniref:helix-turn-helix transcriptional regulator n=1 Tax=Streptomyces niveus TaxID=193462 RepID=UPI003443313A